MVRFKASHLIGIVLATTLGTAVLWFVTYRMGIDITQEFTTGLSVAVVVFLAGLLIHMYTRRVRPSWDVLLFTTLGALVLGGGAVADILHRHESDPVFLHSTWVRNVGLLFLAAPAIVASVRARLQQEGIKPKLGP